MLMALLFCEPDRIGAAAFACDQSPYGESYWNEIHAGTIDTGSLFETAYVTVANPELRRKLMQIGLDDIADGIQLAAELERSIIPQYANQRAA